MKEFNEGQLVYHFEDIGHYPKPNKNERKPSRYIIHCGVVIEKRKMDLGGTIDYKYTVVDTSGNPDLPVHSWLWSEQVFHKLDDCKKAISKTIDLEIKDRKLEKQNIKNLNLIV